MKWLLKWLVCSVNREGVCIHILVKQNRVNEPLHPKYSKDTEVESCDRFLWLKSVTVITITRITAICCSGLYSRINYSFLSQAFCFPCLFFTRSLLCMESYQMESDWSFHPGLLSTPSWLLSSSLKQGLCCGISAQRNHRDGWVRAGNSKRKVKDETEQVRAISYIFFIFLLYMIMFIFICTYCCSGPNIWSVI